MVTPRVTKNTIIGVVNLKKKITKVTAHNKRTCIAITTSEIFTL